MMQFMNTNNQKRVLIIDPFDISWAINDAKEMANRIGFDETSQALISTVVSELSTNIIRYAECGEIFLKVIQEMGKTGIEIEAKDNGPGIKDIEKAMQDHYSTTPNSLGLGLSSVKRIMNEFRIESSPGKGTRIIARKWKSAQQEKSIDCFFASRAMPGGDEECGDLGIIEINENICFLGLIDAVGHGITAREIAVEAKKYITQNMKTDLVNLIKGLHEHLLKTRGIVLALGQLNISTGEINFSGIGNISVKILGPRQLRITLRDGIVGYMISSPRVEKMKLYPGDILVMTSDGVSENFDPMECSDLFHKSAELISKGLISKYGKQNDDASCLTLKLLL